LNGVDWNAVRDSLRPRAQMSGSIVELRQVLTAMLSQLGESHFAVIPREAITAFPSDPSATGRVPGDLGIELRLVGRPAQLLVSKIDSGSPAHTSGIQTGWQLAAIDTLDVARSLAASMQAAEGRARQLALGRLVMQMQAAMRGAADSAATLVLLDHQGQSRRIPLKRRVSPGEAVRYGSLPLTMALVQFVKHDTPSGCVGTIRFNSWMPAVAAQIDAAVDTLRGCAGMVIDLRGNTGGVLNMVVGIAGHFLSSPDTLALLKARASQQYLVANPRFSNASGERVQPFSGPLAILVDELTGSTSETFTAALQSLGRARVFGDTTAGQALPSTTTTLPSGDVFLMAVADILGPRGARIEGYGVVPDVVIPITRTGLAAATDFVLDAALKWVVSTSPNFHQ
jgi:carboxyl-terminal processing protease